MSISIFCVIKANIQSAKGEDFIVNLNYIFTDEQIQKLNEDFEKAQVRTCKQFKIPNSCDELETICLKFIYAYMPISDIASYDMIVFLKIVKDTLRAKKLLPWGDQITGELFLNYVLSYRLNNEDIVDCRELFFNELFPRIKNLSMMEAAIEVNYWCFEKATYQATNMRTISPLGIIKNAYGRCGEESAFLVAALRSVGIPARQCYTPRWAHCDDNHAWVEVWVDGKWEFMGACEPEPVMNKGWFVSPAQRAMLIHARVFSNIVSEPYITNQSAVMTQINILDNYTETRSLQVKVIDKNNKPVQDAQVRFELINFAELFPLAIIKTNADGIARFETGLGDLFIHVSKESKLINCKVDMRKCNGEVIIDFSKAVIQETKSFELDMCAPEALPVNDPEITNEMQELHDKKIAKAVEIRKAYEDTFIRGDKAKEFASTFTSYQDKIEELIISANGNYNEIEKFLSTDDLLDQRVMLLSSLQKKDLSDITAEILEEHMQCALKYQNKFSEEIYQDYILCPRVQYEMITPYRKFITQYFNQSQVASFCLDPSTAYDYIEQHITQRDEFDYATISASPKGLLNLCIGSKISKSILFVAICRTFGIPARVSLIDNSLEYMQDDEWHTIAKSKNDEPVRNCKLTLHKLNNQITLEYTKNFTVAFLDNGVYNTLGFEDISFLENEITYELQAGNYRIMTANRMPNGDVLANIQFVELDSNSSKDVTISLRENRELDESRISVPDTLLKSIDNSINPMSAILNKRRHMVAWIEEGKEPTEHLLNEMLEQQEEFCGYNDKILFVLNGEHSLENNTLQTAYQNINMEIAYVAQELSFEIEVENLFEALNIDNRKLPLVMVLDEKQKCIFSTSGYNVGTGAMVLKYLR